MAFELENCLFSAIQVVHEHIEQSLRPDVLPAKLPEEKPGGNFRLKRSVGHLCVRKNGFRSQKVRTISRWRMVV